jgi:hypothetical protein
MSWIVIFKAKLRAKSIELAPLPLSCDSGYSDKNLAASDPEFLDLL